MFLVRCSEVLDVVVWDVVSCLSQATRLQITQAHAAAAKINLNQRESTLTLCSIKSTHVHINTCNVTYTNGTQRTLILQNLHVRHSCYLKGMVIMFFLGILRQHPRILNLHMEYGCYLKGRAVAIFLGSSR